jgi:threonine synthase
MKSDNHMNLNHFIDKNCKNIWRYSKFYQDLIEPKFRLTVGEGWTKEIEIPKLNQKLKTSHLYLKREDLNPLGSFKVRGLCYQISHAWQANFKKFCISSTGNGALAAAVFCHITKLPLFIFMHPKPKLKRKRETILREIEKFKPEKIFFEAEPTKRCQEFSLEKGMYNLTPSIDSTASEGFKSIGFEIFERTKAVGAIFSFSSSGSSLIGIGNSFKFLQKKKVLKNIPELYSVKNKSGIKREREVKKLVKESRGEILQPERQEIKRAENILLDFGVSTSIEGIMAFSGFLHTLQEKKFKNALIILSGKKW